MKTGIYVHDAMTERPIFLSPDSSIVECAKAMDKYHVATILLKEGNNLAGLISEQDIVRKLIAKKVNPIDEAAIDYMEKKVITITPDKDIFEALVVMRDYNIRHLPVLEGEEVIGLLTLKDVLKIEPQLFELLIEKFELKEEERKPVHSLNPEEGICELCGNYDKKIYEKNNSKVCKECINDV